MLCAGALRAIEPPASAAAGRRNVANAIASVAEQLRNTKAVCRKCYVHPAVIDAYLAGQLQKAMRGLRDEAGVARLLQGKHAHVEKSRPRSRRVVALRERQLRARAWQPDSQRSRGRRAEGTAAAR